MKRTAASLLVGVAVLAASCGGSGIDLDALPSQSSTWEAATGMAISDLDVWGERMTTVCEETEWDTDVATNLGARFITEDVGAAPSFETAQNAGTALAAMARTICPDRFSG